MTKRTLIVFIKPTIMDSQANNIATQKAISDIEKEQQLFNKKDMLLTPEANRYQIIPPVAPLPDLDAAPQTIVE